MQGDALQLGDFVDGEVHQITDSDPWVHFGIDVNRIPDINETEPGFLARGLQQLDELHWFRWCPLAKSDKALSAERRFGYYEAALSGTWTAHLRCYVWPSRLFDREQLRAMLRSISDELGRPIAWEQSSSPVRAYATEGDDGRPQFRGLLADTLRELRAVDHLRHTRFGDHRHNLDDDSPEERLVALWALRRGGQLAEYRQRLQRSVHEHRNAIHDFHLNQARVDLHTARLEEADRELQLVVRAASRVQFIAEAYADVRAALEFTPSMQRDYRLRRLLGAFRSPVQEVVADSISRLSMLPPIKAPEIFELWGAVRIVELLRRLGWKGGRPELRGPTSDEWGVSALDGCQWTLLRDDERIVFDFSPRPRVVDLSAIPLRHERECDVWLWASAQDQQPDDVLFSLCASTPDYALRFYAGQRAALVIGDATLADPQHKGATAKVEKVSKYRREVAWRLTEGRVINCSLGGSFILLPGPSTRWLETTLEAAKSDSYTLCPQPGGADDSETELRLSRLVESMRRSAR